LAEKSKWLWVGDDPIPQNVREATGQIARLLPYHQDRPLAEQLNETALAVIRPNGKTKNSHWLGSLLTELQHTSAVVVFLLPKHAQTVRRMITRHKGQFFCASEDAEASELAWRFSTAAAIQPAIGKLREELTAARHLNTKATRTLEQMDEEMRLAARLQRDFLPRRLPEVGPARFAVLYRPATWVSGDIYDVVRLDETHVGFYVADVVGHGMPAALLTMFIKKALQTKRVVGHSYEIIPPHVSLQELNIDICEQDLPSCQFCTVLYGGLDTSDLTLTIARGGHPEPMVIHADGKVDRLWSEGCLLGIFPEVEYCSARFQLAPGDRLVLYTDGAEDSLRLRPTGQKFNLEKSLSQWGNVTREEMLLQVTAGINAYQVTGIPEDDITVMMMDIEG